MSRETIKRNIPLKTHGAQVYFFQYPVETGCWNGAYRDVLVACLKKDMPKRPHESMFQMQNVKVLAEKFQKCLDEL